MADIEPAPSSLSDEDDSLQQIESGDTVVTVQRRVSPSIHQQEIRGNNEPPLTAVGKESAGDAASVSSTELKPSSASQPQIVKHAEPKIRFGYCLALALAFRLALLTFSVWQDETRWPDGQLRFTDVDYDVFSDAAKALIRGEDIYEARPTYRYSPLIAAIVAPGFWLSGSSSSVPVKSGSEQFFDPPLNTVGEARIHPGARLEHGSTQIEMADPMLARIWGKLVFIMADIACAWLQFEIIQTEFSLRYAEGAKNSMSHANHIVAVSLIYFGWLFNPVTAVVSVRGNAEAVLGVCVLGCLLLVLRRRGFLAGLLFGLCIHLKLYPVIYAPAIYLWFTSTLCRHSPPSVTMKQRVWNLFPRWLHIRFALGTLTSLGILTGLAFHYFGGWRFLHQAYFYHFTRVDIKHNFAPHFYPLYLLSGLEWRQAGLTEAGSLSGLWQSDRTRVWLDRLQQTVAGLAQGSDSGTSSLFSGLLKAGIQSLLIGEVHLRLMKQVFSFASLLPSALLIPIFAYRLHRSPGLCWFATTYVFVTFNKVCTSQYFLWSLVLLPIALASIKLPSSTPVTYVVAESLLIWFGAQATWLAAAYGLEIYTIHSAWFARAVWLIVWAASLFFLLANVVLLRRLIRWRDPHECCSVESIVSNEPIELESKKHR